MNSNHRTHILHRACRLIPFILLLFIAGCGAPATPNPAPSARSQPATGACRPASAAQLAVIRAGVKQEQASNDIRAGVAIKAPGRVNVYLVAAKIYGPNIENGAGPGVWAINGDPDSPGLILAVNGYATSFTPYPDASKTQAAITISEPGVQEVIACAR